FAFGTPWDVDRNLSGIASGLTRGLTTVPYQAVRGAWWGVKEGLEAMDYYRDSQSTQIMTGESAPLWHYTQTKHIFGEKEIHDVPIVGPVLQQLNYGAAMASRGLFKSLMP